MCDIKRILDTPNNEAKNIAESITKLIYMITEDENFKKRRASKRNPNWFDNECKILQNEIRNIAKSVINEPNKNVGKYAFMHKRE